MRAKETVRAANVSILLLVGVLVLTDGRMGTDALMT